MLGLVASGGGEKGSFEVGVLERWIREERRDYGFLAGVSVGAINASKLAEAPPGKLPDWLTRLRHFWDTISNDEVWKWWIGWYVAALWKPSIYNSEPLRELLRKNLDPDLLKASGRKLRTLAVSWNTGEIGIGTEQDDDIADRVAASASFPVFLTPVHLGNQDWTDGGVRTVTPLGEAIRAGCDEIDVIMCSNPNLPDDWTSEGKAAFDYALRVVDMMSTEIIRNDLQVCGLKNEIAKLGGKYRKVKIRLVQPSLPLETKSLDFNQKAIQKMIARGYEDSANPIIF